MFLLCLAFSLETKNMRHFESAQKNAALTWAVPSWLTVDIVQRATLSRIFWTSGRSVIAECDSGRSVNVIGQHLRAFTTDN